jgi:hypothetical protein
MCRVVTYMPTVPVKMVFLILVHVFMCFSFYSSKCYIWDHEGLQKHRLNDTVFMVFVVNPKLILLGTNYFFFVAMPLGIKHLYLFTFTLVFCFLPNQWVLQLLVTKTIYRSNILYLTWFSITTLIAHGNHFPFVLLV